MSYAFSMGRSKRPELNNSVMAKFIPGPGNYKARFDVTESADPKWGFGSGKRPSLKSRNSTNNLGPGAYDIPSTAADGLKYSMGTITVRNKKFVSMTPGPGTYMPPTPSHDNYAFSMGSKLKSIIETSPNRVKSPAPDRYSPKWIFRSDGFTKFSRAKRAGISNEKVARELPSPDHYSIPTTVGLSPKFGFGSSKRPQTAVPTSAPGPGRYTIRTVTSKGDFRAPAKTLHAKISPAFERPGSNKFPGPGAYCSKFTAGKPQDPQWRFGSSKRPELSSSADGPPPNTYNPKFRASLKGSPTWAFGSS